MRGFLKPALFLFVALLIASCGRSPFRTAPTRWENPALPRSQWAGDAAACRRAARREIEKDFRDYPGRGNDFNGGNDNALQSQMNRYEASKRSARLADRCMRLRGYRPIGKANNTPLR